MVFIESLIFVTDSSLIGLVFAICSFIKSVVMSYSFTKANSILSLMADSKSAPLKPSLLLASSAKSISLLYLLRFFRWSLIISLRSCSVGKSTKNISSNLPFRKNSGGIPAILFAVATTKTTFCFSCIQVKNCPKSRVVTSWLPPLSILENAFSSSSIHNTQGLISSVSFNALCIFRSDSPKYLPSKAPISSLMSGISKIFEVILAASDFPQPGTPTIKTPFGISQQNFIAPSRFFMIQAFCSIQSFKPFNPPKSFKSSVASINSNIPDFLTNCLFSFEINSVSFLLISPLS